MSDKSDIRNSLERFINDRKHPHPLVCVVDSIDDTDPNYPTCYCIPVNGDADIIGVRLIVTSAVGNLVRPALQSQVLVSFIDSDNAYVAMFGKVDEVDLNGKSYGGLVEVVPLVTKLNNLENLVNDLVIKFNSHIHVLTLTAGTGTAAPTIAPETTILTDTIRADIENTTVNHGNGT